MRYIYKGGTPLVQEIQQTDVAEGAIAIWALGQMGIVLKGTRQNGFICIDPYLTNSIEQENPGTEFVREYPPPIGPEGLAGALAVLVTHHHNDHLDLSTLRPLAEVSPRTMFAVPASHLSLLQNASIETSRLIAARDEAPFSVGDFSIIPVAAAHTDYQTDEHGNHYYLGYCISINGVRVYHSGDTSVTNRLQERVREFKPHIAMLPINGGDYARTARGIVGNMSDREAADFGVAVGADLLIPVHYDMFPNNRDNPAHFVDYLFHTYRAQKFHMMAPGERFIYVK